MVRVPINAEEMYRVVKTALRLCGYRPAFLHLRLKYAASVTKRQRMASWRMRAALSRFFPISCRLFGRLVFATYAAPLPFRASTSTDIAPNVVSTRPGWMGEWYGT